MNPQWKAQLQLNLNSLNSAHRRPSFLKYIWIDLWLFFRNQLTINQRLLRFHFKIVYTVYTVANWRFNTEEMTVYALKENIMINFMCSIIFGNFMLSSNLKSDLKNKELKLVKNMNKLKLRYLDRCLARISLILIFLKSTFQSST